MIITNLTKKFGKKHIFDHSEFVFPHGKVTYITGESGRGKTTLLRILAGLDKSYSGKILDGYKKISYVFQEPRLFHKRRMYSSPVIMEKKNGSAVRYPKWSLRGFISLTISPSKLSNPAMQRNNVVLPAPFSPMMPQILPR